MHSFFSVSGRRLLFVFLFARWRAATLACTLDLLANVCVIAQSLLLAQAVATLFGFQSLRGSLLGITPVNTAALFIWLFSIMAFKFLLDYARLRLRNTLSEDFAHHLRSVAFGQHLRADLRYHESREPGRSLLRFSGDLGSIQRLLSRGVFQSAADLTLLLMGLGIIAWLDGQLALLVGGMAAFGWFLTLQINHPLRKIEEQRRSKKAGLLAYVNTTLLHLSGIQALNRNNRTVQRFSRKAEKVRLLGHRYHRLASLSDALPLFFVQFLLLSVLVFGWQRGLPGAALFMAVLVLISWRSPFSRLLKIGLLWKKGLLSLEKIDLLALSPVATQGNTVLEKKHARTLLLRGVGFCLEGKTLLHPISFQLSVGETLCLHIGMGGGKTLLVKLLAGLYHPTAGTIEWGGQAAEIFTNHSLRRQIAFVSDAFPLIGSTLLDALSNSSQVGALAETEETFRHWQAHFPSLQNLDLHQKMATHSSVLSAGQHRLLKCLRAVLTGKPFLVLDEPFAGLDLAAAKILAGILDKFRAGRGVLLLTAQPELLASIGWMNGTESVLDRPEINVEQIW